MDRDEILAALNAAQTHVEQLQLVAALDTYDRQQAEDARDNKQMFATAGIRAPQPVTSINIQSSYHNPESDWLLNIKTAADDDGDELVLGKAAVWYQGVPEFVKQSSEEFSEQLRGFAQRITSPYGPAALGKFATVVDFVGTMYRQAYQKEIEQLYDRAGEPDATPLPEETYDTFGDEVHPDNVPIEKAQQATQAQDPYLLNNLKTQAAVDPKAFWNTRKATPENGRLEEIQQSYNENGEPDPTPLPEEQAFPLEENWVNNEQIRAAQPTTPLPGTAKKSAAFVKEASYDDADFSKGYNYGSNFGEGSVLVTAGSAAFEAGLYAGLVDNEGGRGLFSTASVESAHPDLTERLDAHSDWDTRVAAINLDTPAPLNPDVSQVDQRGTVPPLLGQDNPAAPGGPAPYNGAAPYGRPAVPDDFGVPAVRQVSVNGGGNQNEYGKKVSSLRDLIAARKAK